MITRFQIHPGDMKWIKSGLCPGCGTRYRREIYSKHYMEQMKRTQKIMDTTMHFMANPDQIANAHLTKL